MPIILILPLLLIALILILLIVFLRMETRNLSERNKRLAALRKMDEVMMSASTDLKDIAQKVTDAIAFELGFEIGVLALIDESRGVLKRVAMSNTQTGIEAKKVLPFPYESLEIPLNVEQNLSIQAIKTGEKKVTHNLYDVFFPVLEKSISQKIQETVGIKTSLVYPVKAKGRTIGVMIISIGREEDQLSQYERESIENLVDVVGITLENALLYQNLRETSHKLTQANQKLKELDKLKDDFVSVASHELRTPMAAIKSYAWMALHRSGMKLPDKLERYLIRVLLSSERLINLVNDLLNISRIESGRIEINPEEVDTISLIKDIADEVYYSKSREKNIKIIILEQKLPKVLADPEKLRQVLLNIMGNAVKFSPHGGKITIGFFTDGVTVETFVKDEGPGISKDDIGRLFQKFGRLDNSYVATATSGGTGLGLYISKNLIELMRGRIWARSEGVGRGATFTISLPVATPSVLENIEKYRVMVKGEVKGLESVAI